MKLSCYVLPNRHGLATGEVWDWFREELPSGTTIEVINALAPVQPTGDRVLLMGQRTLQQWVGADASIFTSRGAPLQVLGRPATATFDLQDAYDFVSQGHDNVHEESKSQDATFKDRATTQKRNWPFWIVADATKLLTVPMATEEPKLVAAPQNVDYYIHRLSTLKGHTLYLDIEVSIDAGKLDCFGVAIDDSPVVVFPVYDYRHELYYSRATTLRLLAALGAAMTNNLTVVHNGMFDLVYLLTECRLPIGNRVFDTMLCQQRLFPEIEKSLGHAISMWTWQPWHKGEGGTPHTKQGQERYWQYNAKDVWCTRMVHRAQLAYLAANPTYQSSVDQVMASVRPYVIMTATGCRISKPNLARKLMELIARRDQYGRILRLLTNLPKLNPASVDQLRKFFFETLAYKPTGYTASGKPELGEKQIYQLALAYDNPALQVLLAYRELDKEISMASFQGWCLPWREAVEMDVTR